MAICPVCGEFSRSPGVICGQCDATMIQDGSVYLCMEGDNEERKR